MSRENAPAGGTLPSKRIQPDFLGSRREGGFSGLTLDSRNRPMGRTSPWFPTPSARSAFAKMTQQRQSSLIIVTVLCLGAAVAAASTLGMARAKGSYTVQRATQSLKALAELPFVLNAGDEVKAAKQFVRIQGTAGHAILLGRGSTVQLPDQKTVELKKGEMAVSVPPSSPLETRVQDLIVIPQAPDAAKPPTAGTLAMGNTAPGDVSLIAQGSSFRVLSLPDRNQVAMVSASEGLRLVKDSLGNWMPRPLAQDGGAQGDPSEEDNSNAERAGILGLFGGGGGGSSTVLLVGGGIVVAGGVTVGTIEGIQAIEDAQNEPKKDEETPTPSPTPTPTEPPNVSKITP